MLEILMMTPGVPRPAMRAAASRPHRNTPVRLTAMTCCQSASDIVSTTSPSRALTSRPSRVMPALLIRPSTGPIACSSESNAAATAASSETSATAVAWPLPGSEAAASASASPSRSIRPMRAPAAASSVAMARPSPRAAPVMMMCLSTSSMQPLLVIWLFGYFVAWWRRVGGSGFVFGFVARERRLQCLGPQRKHALLKLAVGFDRGRSQLVKSRLAQRFGKGLFQRLLLRLEVGHDFFEVIARHVAHRIGVDPDHGLEEFVAQHRSAEHFLVGHDLKQHLAGDVGTGLGLDHLHRVAGSDHVTDVFQVDRLTGLGIVKTPVGVFPDDSLGICHGLSSDEKIRDCSRSNRGAGRS